MQRIMTRLLAKVSIIAMAFSTVLAVAPVKAGGITSFSDTLTRQKISVAADHTIEWTTASGVTDDGSTITLTWESDFDLSSITASDVDIEDDTVGLSTGADCTGLDEAGISVSGQTLTIEICNGDGGAIAGGSTLVVEVGTHADGGVNQITNPTSAGSYTLTLAGSQTDSGTAEIAIVDDDQVTVTATVAEEMVFDLDVGTTTGTDSNAPYTVALGTLETSSVSTSGDGTINMIGVDVDTNATNGAVVQVRNDNGSNGLESTSVSADFIPTVSSTTLTAGTEGYGICVYQVKASAGTFQSAGFHSGGTLTATADTSTSSTCDDSTHQIDTGLTTTFQDILNSDSDPVNGGRGEIFVKAAISSTTEAHDDYTDTLTFRATATF